MTDGLLDEHIVVDRLQGGAGTSTNMNVNEVLANRALQLLGAAARRLRPRLAARRPQPPPDHQRHLPHGAAPRRHPAAAPAGGAGRRAAGGVPGQGAGVRPRGQGRAHAAAGRRADHAGPRDGRLRRGPQPRPLAHLQVRGAAARGQPRRHGHRHRLRRAAAVHLPRRRRAARAHRHRLRARREPRRGHAERRRVRRGLRHPQGARRHAAEDLAATCACCARARGRARRDPAAAAAGRLVASCPARSTR